MYGVRLSTANPTVDPRGSKLPAPRSNLERIIVSAATRRDACVAVCPLPAAATRSSCSPWLRWRCDACSVVFDIVGLVAQRGVVVVHVVVLTGFITRFTVGARVFLVGVPLLKYGANARGNITTKNNTSYSQLVS